MTSTPPASGVPATPPESGRRMAPTYIAVIVLEVLTLAALWWFQTAFGR